MVLGELGGRMGEARPSHRCGGLVLQPCPTLCDPVDCSSPSPSVHGILQTRILVWVAISFSRDSSPPRDQTWVSCITGGFFTNWAIRKPKHDLLMIPSGEAHLSQPEPGTQGGIWHLLLHKLRDFSSILRTKLGAETSASRKHQWMSSPVTEKQGIDSSGGGGRCRQP